MSDGSEKENGSRHTGDIVINPTREEVRVEIADPRRQVPLFETLPNRYELNDGRVSGIYYLVGRVGEDARPRVYGHVERVNRSGRRPVREHEYGYRAITIVEHEPQSAKYLECQDSYPRYLIQSPVVGDPPKRGDFESPILNWSQTIGSGRPVVVDVNAENFPEEQLLDYWGDITMRVISWKDYEAARTALQGKGIGFRLKEAGFALSPEQYLKMIFPFDPKFGFRPSREHLTKAWEDQLKNNT